MYELVNRLLHQADLAVSKTMDKSMSHGLLRNYRKIPEMRLEEIARECYVSPATLSRFCSKVDHVNYSHLSKAAKEELAFFDEQAKDFIHTLKLEDLSTEAVAEDTLDNLVNGLVSLKSSIDYGAIVQIARGLFTSSMGMIILHKAHRAAVVDFQLNMTLLGKTVFCTNSEEPDISPRKRGQRIMVIVPTSIDHFVEDAMTDAMKNTIAELKAIHDVSVVYISMHPERYILREKEFMITLPHPVEKLPFPTLMGKQMLEAVLDMIYYSCFYMMVSGEG